MIRTRTPMSTDNAIELDRGTVSGAESALRKKITHLPGQSAGRTCTVFLLEFVVMSSSPPVKRKHGVSPLTKPRRDAPSALKSEGEGMVEKKRKEGSVSTAASTTAEKPASVDNHKEGRVARIVV